MMLFHKSFITSTNPSPSSLHRIKSILCYEEEGPVFFMNEMDHKFGKIVIFSKQYKILEIRKSIRWPWCLPSIYLKQCPLAHKLFLEYVLKLKKCDFSSIQNS